MTTQAERDHAAKHRVATWHHSFDVKTWAEDGVIVRQVDDESPVLMLRDRRDWERLVYAVEHAFVCAAVAVPAPQPEETAT